MLKQLRIMPFVKFFPGSPHDLHTDEDQTGRSQPLTPHHDLPQSAQSITALLRIWVHWFPSTLVTYILCPLMSFSSPPSPCLEILRPRHDTPSTNLIVGIAGEKGLAISRPSQRDTLGVVALLADCGELRLELVNLALFLQVENDDAAGSSGTQPVSVGREDKSVDLVIGVQ